MLLEVCFPATFNLEVSADCVVTGKTTSLPSNDVEEEVFTDAASADMFSWVNKFDGGNDGSSSLRGVLAELLELTVSMMVSDPASEQASGPALTTPTPFSFSFVLLALLFFFFFFATVVCEMSEKK